VNMTVHLDMPDGPYTLIEAKFDVTMHQSGLWVQYRNVQSGAWQFARIPDDATGVRFEAGASARKVSGRPDGR
jgi:hypothetical protein